jgi:hypothetical protein
MGWAQMFNTVTSALVVFCTAVFIAVYQRAAPWRSTPLGRYLMGLAASIGALGLDTVLITVWPSGVTAEALRTARTVLLLTIVTVMLRLATLVVIAQKDNKPEDGS